MRYLISFISKPSNKKSIANVKHTSRTISIFAALKNVNDGDQILLNKLFVENEAQKRKTSDQNREKIKLKMQNFITSTRRKIEDKHLTVSDGLPADANTKTLCQIHLSLIEYLLNEKMTENTQDLIVKSNKLFEQLFSIRKNAALSSNDIRNAFNLVLDKDFICLFRAFNRFYKFEQNVDLLKDRIDAYMKSTSAKDSIKLFLIKEMKLKTYSHLINVESVFLNEIKQKNLNAIVCLIEQEPSFLDTFVKACNKLCSPVRADSSSKISSTDVSILFANVCIKLKQFELIESEFCKSVVLPLKLKQLHSVFQIKNSKFIDSMSTQGWIELLIDSVGNDDMLIEHLFKHFCLVSLNKKPQFPMLYYFKTIYGDKYLHKYMSDENKHDFYSNMELHKEKFMQIIALEEQASARDEYFCPDELKASKGKNFIEFIATPEKFRSMLDFFANNSSINVVGLDCEWKPWFSKELYNALNYFEKYKRPNTLQIATRHKVFIIEMKYLADRLNMKDKAEFLERILFNKSLLRLGYQFDQDYKMLSYSFLEFKEMFQSQKLFVNLDDLALRFESKYKLSDSYEPWPKARGLSKLTSVCFGKPLNKLECISNWENIPLRQSQLEYAAIDSLVLIKIYEYIQKRCAQLNVEFVYEYSNGKLEFK